MPAQIVFYPQQAATIAAKVDYLLLGLVIVCGSVGVLIAVLLITFAVRYRRRPGMPRPPALNESQWLEIAWTITPLLIFVGLFAWGAKVYYDAFRSPDDATVIYGVGKQWMWKFQHPHGQREINELHVTLGQPFKLLLTSEDVVHSFFVPDFRVHMDVLPGRYTSVWFQPTRPGTYHLFCSQYCGTNHARMIGKVVVMEPREYQSWLASEAEGSLALQGRKTFLKHRCLSCHSADEHARAPVLENLFGKVVPLRDGRTVRADEAYIRESILNPAAKIVAGFDNIMPTFQGQIDEEEMYRLIAYLQALRAGETPQRVEDFPPPGQTPTTDEKKP